MARLAVHVTPRAGEDRVAEWRGSELSVRVSAAPDSGNANRAVCRVVAKSLGISRSSVSVIRGGASRHKMLEVTGVDDAGIEAAFGRPDAALF
jgi:uncharacterized protein YggU (UPF0235/DUF167 family)